MKTEDLFSYAVTLAGTKSISTASFFFFFLRLWLETRIEKARKNNSWLFLILNKVWSRLLPDKCTSEEMTRQREQ